MSNDNLPISNIMTGKTVATLCRCLLDCEGDKENSTCILQPNAKCYRKLFLDPELGEVEMAGCLGSQDDFLDQCNPAADPDFPVPTDLKCCNDQDLCNDFLEMKLPPTLPPDHLMDNPTLFALIISIAVAFFLFLVCIGGCLFRFKRQEMRRKKQIDKENDRSMSLPGQKHRKLNDLIAEYSSPGTCSSGSGVPLLVQRTIARQIELISELGRGRYGKVMLGKWREEKVAVKIFNTIDEDSWFCETEIYQTVLLRHENILCFIASDINGTGSWTQLYLITDYHENGSLYDYLNKRTQSVSEALVLAHTAACGLAHLHIEIIGTQGKPTTNTVQDVNGKPGIAHRDIKSKNILVKRDGTCCIADMGLAVKYNGVTGEVKKGNYDKSCRQGTKRYMSPEVLNGTFQDDSFDAYKASDVYSFALVMWEVLNCVEMKDAKPGYLLPYYDVVGNDPDFDEMRKVVDIDDIRPDVPTACTKNQVFSRYVETMQECWTKRPESRLSMLRVRKTLHSLVDEVTGKSDRTNVLSHPYSNNYIYSNNSSVNKEMYNAAITRSPGENNEFIPTHYPPNVPVIHSGIHGQIHSNGNYRNGQVHYVSDGSASSHLLSSASTTESPIDSSA